MNALNQFIPSGTEVVILRNGEHYWHTTSKDVPVNNADAQNCPIREVPVLTMVVQGFRIWFLESQVNVVLSEEQKQAAGNLQLAFLQYDIPTSVTRRGGVAHPSQYLWRFGVRTSLSCWVIPYRSIPRVELRELTRAGCTWHVTRTDSSEAPVLLQRAIAALQTERATAIQSAAESRRRAEERMNNGQGDINTRMAKREKDLRLIEKRLAEDLQNIASGAAVLGIPVEWTEFSSIRSVLRASDAGEKQAAEDAGKTYDRANALGTKEGRNVAAMVRSGAMPADIAADYVADNETFSLVDGDDENE